jgi:anaerobic nitric oxide reductase flavorubredoxin
LNTAELIEVAMSILVKNNIHWVGQRDWEVRDFHGTEYKTLRGSSYNSYLIREEKMC